MPGTTTVACKVPTGMVLSLYRMEDHDEPLLHGGYRTVKRAVLDTKPNIPARVKLNGCARRIGGETPHEVAHGAGLTFGVDADFFTAWLKQNAETEIVQKGLVFAQVKAGDIQAQAKDHRALKSGLEPIDPKNLPPEFKGKIETADVGK